jgi:hypothetical protein
MIELDYSINYLISVFSDSLSMFPEIDCEHDFIQFGIASEVDKSDKAFIWDLTVN